MVVKERKNSAAQNVRRAKARFLEAAASVAPLNYVRRHPLRSVGCSLLLGMGLGLLRRGAGGLALVPLLLQTTELAQRLGLLELPLRRKNAGD